MTLSARAYDAYAAGDFVGADAHIRPHGWRKGYRQTCVGADGSAPPDNDNPSVMAEGRDTSAALRRTTQCAPQGYLLRGEHWAASQREARGVPRLRARRGDVGIAPYEAARGAADNDGRTESSERNT